MRVFDSSHLLFSITFIETNLRIRAMKDGIALKRAQITIRMTIPNVPFY